jgi:N-methylhydantoinase A
LQTDVDRKMPGARLQVLRSDGGLAAVDAARDNPVQLLMSGPAGGVTGALWIARQSGFKNLLTFDMGGTSTDVALIENGIAQTRRETRVADVTVLAPSIDVRTVGAGGGSIAYVPELTKALRVGPQSAGADPGPAAYCKGGERPTVTDANIVLGYLPVSARLGGDMMIDRELAVRAVKTVADTLGRSVEEAAEGIIDIVNENMFGALRLVSIEQGHDPRDFALVGFGGAGPLHANALGRLTGAWPVIIPPGPGVLCAYGDATTRLRDEASRTFIRRFPEITDAEVLTALDELRTTAQRTLLAEGVAADLLTVAYQLDVRYQGQGMRLSIDVDRAAFERDGLAGVGRRFDEVHAQLYTFALEADHELVSLRAIVQGPETLIRAERMETAGADPVAAEFDRSRIFVDGAWHEAHLFDRSRLRPGNLVPGPAVICQMDTTTLILPGHTGEVDNVGNILIRPNS